MLIGEKGAKFCLFLIQQVLLSRVSFFGSKDILGAENIALQLYRKTAEAVLCGLLPNSRTPTSQRTDGNNFMMLNLDL